MKNWKLMTQYDGSLFYGFQIQDDYVTVQGELQKAIYQLTGRQVVLNTAGRTDKGVHARCQVSNFYMGGNFSAENFKTGINHYITKGIQVVNCEEVSSDFHARYSCKEKTYKYILCNKYYMEPWFLHYKGHRKYPLDYGKMKKAASYIEGIHDFSSFATDLEDDILTFRVLKHLKMEKIQDDIIFTLTAKSFLRNMVRIIIGTLIEVGRGKRDVDFVKKSLLSRDRRQAGPTAESCGLYLWDIKY